MKINKTFLLENFPGDNSIIEQFYNENSNIEFKNENQIMDEYIKFVSSLDLEYIEDIV